jgi:amino acid permease
MEASMGRHQPALLGGLFIGVLSSLPVISTANVCCCLWVVAGGVLVVYHQQQARPEPVETADAVLGGLIAGVIGALITCLGQYIVYSFTGELWQEAMRESFEQNSEIPPEMRDTIIRLLTGRGLWVLLLAFMIPVNAVFAMLGSLLGLAFFRKKLPPVPPQG